jgi:hypothetical protein
MIADVHKLTDEHRSVVGSTLQKLEIGGELSSHEQFALEAIIIPDKRPAIDIRDGDFTVVHPLWLHYGTEPIKGRLKAALPGIGRIEVSGIPGLPYGGTGFVVGTGLIMTNRHVAELFTNGLGRRNLAFRPGLGSGIDLKRERDNPESQYLRVRDVLMIHPYWDLALLQVDGLSEQNPPIALSLDSPDQLAGHDVAIVGYPAFDPRNPADVQNQVFGGVYYVKRLQPGKLGERRSVRSFDHTVSAMTHDASTLGGNSGSAVIDVETGTIVALHFAGVYLDANFTVPSAELARDRRVIEAGVRFHSAVAGDDSATDQWWGSVESTAVPRRPDAPAASSAPVALSIGSPSQGFSTANGGATWTIPLYMRITVGEPVRIDTVAVPSDGESGAPDDITSVPAERRRSGAHRASTTPRALRGGAGGAPDTTARPLDRIRQRLETMQRILSLAYIAEFEGTPPSGLEARIAKVVPGLAGLEPVFRNDPRFVRVVFPGVDVLALGASPFELVEPLRIALGANSVEPDLATDFFPEKTADDAQRESVDILGCWVGDAEAPPSDRAWALRNLRVPEAWAFSVAQDRPSRGEAILIAQPDTGITNHPELAGAIDEAHSANLIEGGAPTDPLETDGLLDNPGHGTGTGSVVASRGVVHLTSTGGPGLVTGSAPAARLVPIRCIESVSRLTQSRVARAIEHAVDSGCHIVTMSLGGVWSRSLGAAVERAIESNLIVLAAAGNCVRFVVWPARFERCIAVAGSNVHDDTWRGSCRGEAVDVAAPAQHVWRASRKPDDTDPAAVGPGEGTSFAVALTAGVAAIWLSHHGRERLIASLGPSERLQDRWRISRRRISRRGISRRGISRGSISR